MPQKIFVNLSNTCIGLTKEYIKDQTKRKQWNINILAGKTMMQKEKSNTHVIENDMYQETETIENIY
jgi:hypothetical protein